MSTESAQTAGPSAAIAPTRPPLRLATIGSVDDGKSTLIGRLLYDTKSIPLDQLEAIERASKDRGLPRVDLSLLTDGLRAEREQGITIDVAYRYFGTPTRRFIVADAPGHTQYTRNMATAASVADLVIVLVDARQGLTEQTRRHLLIAALMRVPGVVLAVNKIDLVEDARGVFERITRDFRESARVVGVEDVVALPVSAVHGDNIVSRGSLTPWYHGPTLLDVLESAEPAPASDLPLRLPIQYVIRPQTDDLHDYRGYAGAISAGTIAPGDEVVVLPAGLRTRVERVHLHDRELPEAAAPQAVTVTLAHDIDAARGDVIAAAHDAPALAREIVADVIWLDESPLRVGGRYVLKQGPRSVKAVVESVEHRVDPADLTKRVAVAQGATLSRNDIGRVRIRASAPIIYDTYAKSRAGGAFILIDEATASTAAGGLIVSGQAEGSPA